MEKKIKITDFYKCVRCGIDSSTPRRNIPCPRGGCEADVIGQVKVTTETEFIPIQFDKLKETFTPS